MPLLTSRRYFFILIIDMVVLPILMSLFAALLSPLSHIIIIYYHYLQCNIQKHSYNYNYNYT